MRVLECCFSDRPTDDWKFKPMTCKSATIFKTQWLIATYNWLLIWNMASQLNDGEGKSRRFQHNNVNTVLIGSSSVWTDNRGRQNKRYCTYYEDLVGWHQAVYKKYWLVPTGYTGSKQMQKENLRGKPVNPYSHRKQPLKCCVWPLLHYTVINMYGSSVCHIFTKTHLMGLSNIAQVIGMWWYWQNTWTGQWSYFLLWQLWSLTNNCHMNVTKIIGTDVY